MQNDYSSLGTQKTNTVSIVSLISAFIFPLLGFVLAIVSLRQIKRTNEKGRPLAIAGLIISLIVMMISVFALFVVFSATPALQNNTQDSSLKNDAMIITSAINSYQAQNSGKLPTAQQIQAQNLTTITSITENSNPTATTAAYTPGKDCAGVSNPTAFSVTILLDNGKTYCTN